MRAQFHLDPVARNQPDEIPLGIARQMAKNSLLPFQHQLKNQTRPLFYDCRWNRYGLVSTHGPFSVTAMQCSK